MKQLIIIADMEGASGIFSKNSSWLWNGSADWREHGRECITSDALAIVNASIDFGIDDILLYDGHFAGNPEFNIILEKLPPIVRVFDVPDRCFYWRRMRGQAVARPFGIITFGQHARFGEDNAYFAHTMQSPPIKSLFWNGKHIAEIGSAVLSFHDAPYLANVGCAASMREALELSDKILTIPVKDMAKGWEPSPQETYSIIYDGVTKALHNVENTTGIFVGDELHRFSMQLCDGYFFDTSANITWKGIIENTKATWEAPSIEIGLELFNYVRRLIKTYG
ncbi:MAG: M55 family metallopeptidase [Oscillospiraceae bacterium]|jgi:D-aminopeptidase|nr:M55 family metallopeptidase [Oscillospiraceae bacterium]